jgi:hypothetical protein
MKTSTLSIKELFSRVQVGVYFEFLWGYIITYMSGKTNMKPRKRITQLNEKPKD